MALRPGTALRSFEIVALLGAGGMGEVYRARDTVLGREVAIKVLPEELLKRPEALARLRREAQAIAALSHPNILAIYQFDVDDGNGMAFLVTELLEGETVRALVSRGPVSWRRATDICASVADACGAAHAKGVIHRDLKPENIFLTTDGRVKVLDFGLARTTSEFPRGDAHTTHHLTDPGTVLGTVNYMSPEQLRGEPAGPPSDVFAIGCVLYEMLGGVPPFRSASTVETMSAILREPPPPLDAAALGVPEELLAILNHCLEKKPEDRFQAARDLAFDFKSLASGSHGRRIASGPEAIDSMAVLPFENSSGDAEMDYLTDGITETIISRLGRLPGLRVMARSTVFRYKGKDVEPRAIGQALNVRALLTGRVQPRGAMLTIWTELVNVADGALLWSERYHRAATDLLAIETDIASEVADKLRVRLGARAAADPGRAETRNNVAHQAYLKGRYHWNKRSESGFRRGIDFFKQALEEDPTYALAWGGLADSHNVAGFYSVLPPQDAFPRAEAAARRALELDPTSAEAHASLGYALWMHRWAREASDPLFQRSFELNANYPTGHYWYGWTLVTQGRCDEGFTHLRRSIELDPLSTWINSGVGWSLYLCRDFTRAAEQLRKTLALDEGFGLPRAWLALTLLATGRADDALREARAAASWRELTALPLHALAVAQAGTGDRAGALQTRDELIRASDGRYLQPYYLAAIAAALGDTDEALDWLARGLAERSHLMVMLGVDPEFDRLRGLPRFQELVAAIGVSRPAPGT